MSQPNHEYTNKQHNAVDQIGLYDNCLQQLLEEIEFNEKILDGKKPPVVQATPDKAFATIREILKRNDTNTRPDVGNLLNVPLPFVSFTRTTMTYDSSRFNAAPLRLLKAVRDIDQQPDMRAKDYADVRFGSVQAPLPYIFTYQLDVWARNIKTLNLLAQWQMTANEHGEYLYREIDFKPVHDTYGTKWARITLNQFNDNSDLEPGDQRNRTLRYTATASVDAWLWRPVKTVKVGKVLQLQIVQGPEGPENPEILGEVEVDLVEDFIRKQGQ